MIDHPLSLFLKQWKSHALIFLREGYSQNNWVGGCSSLPKTLTLFMTSLQANLWTKSAILPTLTKNLIPFLWLDTKIAAKWLKSIPYLWPKRLKNPTLWGRTYLCSPYKGVPPPLPPGPFGNWTDSRPVGNRNRGWHSLTNAVWAEPCINKSLPENLENRPEFWGDIPKKSQTSRYFKFSTSCLPIRGKIFRFPREFCFSPETVLLGVHIHSIDFVRFAKFYWEFDYVRLPYPREHQSFDRRTVRLNAVGMNLRRLFVDWKQCTTCLLKNVD